jgi:hypothetical protein
MRITPVFFVSLLLVSCDAFYQIPINGETGPLRLSVDCGSMEIKMINWQGHAFDFYQDCNFEKPVIIYSDSIKAIWKNKTFPLRFIGPDYGNKKSLTITGKAEIRTAFHIDEAVKEGDTIIVIPAGYLYCNGQKLPFDTLRLVAIEDLKSPLEKVFGWRR